MYLCVWEPEKVYVCAYVRKREIVCTFVCMKREREREKDRDPLVTVFNPVTDL